MKFSGALPFPRGKDGGGGVVLHLGSPGAVCGGRVRPLYVSWFRKVGDESYHYPDVHAGAYSDGEGGEEQSPSGRDVGQREVTFVHRLGGLEEKEMQKEKTKVRNSLKGPRERERERERDWPIFQKRRNYRSRPVSFCGAVRKIWMMGPLAERLGVTWEELIMRGGTKKKKWQLVRKCQGRKVMVISAAGTEW